MTKVPSNYFEEEFQLTTNDVDYWSLTTFATFETWNFLYSAPETIIYYIWLSAKLNIAKLYIANNFLVKGEVW